MDAVPTPVLYNTHLLQRLTEEIVTSPDPESQRRFWHQFFTVRQNESDAVRCWSWVIHSPLGRVDPDARTPFEIDCYGRHLIVFNTASRYASWYGQHGIRIFKSALRNFAAWCDKRGGHVMIYTGCPRMLPRRLTVLEYLLETRTMMNALPGNVSICLDAMGDDDDVEPGVDARVSPDHPALTDLRPAAIEGRPSVAAIRPGTIVWMNGEVARTDHEYHADAPKAAASNREIRNGHARVGRLLFGDPKVPHSLATPESLAAQRERGAELFAFSPTEMARSGGTVPALWNRCGWDLSDARPFAPTPIRLSGWGR